MRHGPAEVLKKLNAGEKVDQSLDLLPNCDFG
jgi:hypothetical protein